MARSVHECPDRHSVTAETAECRYLRRLTGPEGVEPCRVPRDLCAACCDSLLPTETYLNPAIASRLYALSEQLLEQADVTGTRRLKFERLRTWAEESLALGGLGAAPAPVGRPARPGPTSDRVGLIGENSQRGLGSLYRDFAHNYPAERWLAPQAAERDLSAFLDGLDWLLFFEGPASAGVVRKARERGVRIVCVPMWEWLDEQAPWLPLVDLMIAPTRACYEMLIQWRERLGMGWEVGHVPWPIDVDRFPFRQRTVCRRFLFVNGSGGVRELDRPRERWDGRKGAGVVAEAARLAPDVSILVLSQTANLPAFPTNVEVRTGPIDDPADLYREGDLCLQPSRWEGLGLPLLECQARGLPLIATDAPPMNEHHPWRVLPCSTVRAKISGVRSFPVHEVDPRTLAQTLRELQGRDIAEASRAARHFVMENHSWPVARPRLQALLNHSPQEGGLDLSSRGQ